MSVSSLFTPFFAYNKIVSSAEEYVKITFVSLTTYKTY